VCYYSGFGVDVCFQSCSECLTGAAKRGIVAAQNYFEVIYEAMGLPHEGTPAYQAHLSQKPMATPFDERDEPTPDAPEIQEPAPENDKVWADESECEFDFESDSEYTIGHTKRAVLAPSMPQQLSEILERGRREEIQAYLEDKPEFLNSQDSEGNTPLILAAKSQHVEALNFLVTQPGVDANITNNSEQTVLHLIPSFDETFIRDLVPKLVEKHADINHEALPVPLGTEDNIFTTGIRCCSILSTILHNNMVLLECLLEASHSRATNHPCRICETGSRFRRILAVSLSLFRSKALNKLMDHLSAHGKSDNTILRDTRVWANQELLPVHLVPFKSVAIGALDLPKSFFRAISFGADCLEALEVSVAKANVIVVTIGLLYVRTVRGSNDCRIVDA
jgi:hypothetical protein